MLISQRVRMGRSGALLLGGNLAADASPGEICASIHAGGGFLITAGCGPVELTGPEVPVMAEARAGIAAALDDLMRPAPVAAPPPPRWPSAAADGYEGFLRWCGRTYRLTAAALMARGLLEAALEKYEEHLAGRP